ncbi:MAG: glutamine-hydrolyzing GMP synthase [Treponema sp.]|nr:glutamine-hydrolyzing GMP synthase [Treponema sp.]
MTDSKIVVLDFGSQYAHLIAKRLRMMGYYSEIALPSADVGKMENVKGIILSGGPASVYDSNIPEFNEKNLELDVPILGLCYGHHVMATNYGGKVEKAEIGEFGFAQLNKTDAGKNSPLLKGVSDSTQVWMSHQDGIMKLPEGFEVIGTTKDCPYAAIQNLEKKRFSLQCHCEVKDTLEGNTIFQNFAGTICGMKKNWDEDAVLNHIMQSIQEQAKDKNVLLFLSGGVDSTVAFALLNRALGQERVLGLHIDNGFMRKNESANVAQAYRSHGFNNFIVEDASESFLKAVYHLTDPQQKRMAVGENFITVRNEVVAKQKLDEEKWMLAQGTLYPDIIESGGTKNSRVIKTHHNRVDGIQKLIEKGLIIEPLKDLYKDEVRRIGKKIGLEDDLVMRHPFPGPGLSINVLCSNGEMSDTDKSDFEKANEEIKNIKLDMFCPNCTKDLVLSVLPVRSVGVQGDYRTYRFPSVLTFKEEGEGFHHIPGKWSKLEEAASTITNASTYINRAIIRLYQNPEVKISDMKLQEGYCDKGRLDQLREADNIMLTALHKNGWYEKIFQHLTINLPYSSAKDHCSIVLRPLCSEDVMTARFAQMPQEDLLAITKEIAKLPYVDAIFFDLTNKPPATFGWE